MVLTARLYDQAINSFGCGRIEGTVGMAVANALSDKKEIAVILLEKLQEKGEKSGLENLKQHWLGIKPPKSNADSLLQVLKNRLRKRILTKAVQTNPFDAKIVSAARNI